MLDHIHRLFTHMAWANSQTLTSLHGSASPKAIALFAHILGSEHTWLSRIHGLTPEIPVWPDLSLAECEVWAARNQKQYTEFVGALDVASLARQIDYRSNQGIAFVSTISDILLHVTLHGSYHRGQIATAVREIGGTPASTDFIAFARGVPIPSKD